LIPGFVQVLEDVIIISCSFHVFYFISLPLMENGLKLILAFIIFLSVRSHVMGYMLHVCEWLPICAFSLLLDGSLVASLSLLSLSSVNHLH
jgi:hypothetical protein